MNYTFVSALPFPTTHPPWTPISQVLHYEAYGSAYIKTHKLSPDAWAQLIKQLAFFKMHGRLGVTYESAQTRKFKKGRTEVVRSVSAEGAEWVKAMVDPSAHKGGPVLYGEDII
jgi:carnitine O-acetyltransferase